MAGKSLGTLTLDLVAKIGGFVDGLSKAERESKKRMDGIKKSVSGVGTAIAALGAGAAVGTAALVKSQIDLADEFSKQSKIVGVAIDDWSALSYAADLSDVSNQQLIGSMTKLSRSVGSAVEGVGAGADAFKALGIEIKNTDGTLKSNYQLFGEIAEQFSLMEDGAVKTALAQDLLGKSGAKLIPLLNGGAKGISDMRREAEAFGLVIDEKTGAAAEEFNDNLTRLQKVVSGTGITLASELLPSLVEFTDLIKEPETQEAIKAIVKGVADVAIFSAKAATEIVNLTKFVAEATAAAVGGIDSADTARLDGEIASLQSRAEKLKVAISADDFNLANRLAGIPDALKAELASVQFDLEKLTKQRDQYNAVMNSIVTPPKPADQPSTKPTKQVNMPTSSDKKAAEEVAAAAKAIDDAYKSQLETLQRQIALTDEATEAEKVRFEIAHGGLKGITDEQAKQLIQMAEVVDANNEIAESAEAVQKRQKEYADLVADLRTDEEKLTDQVRERLKLLDSMPVSGAERSDVVSRIADAATTEAPTYEGLAPEIGGDFGELMKLDDAQKELDEWYSTQLSMLDSFRQQRSDLNSAWDEEELKIKQQHQDELARIDTARNLLAITSAESAFGSLADIAKTALGENSKTYRAMFALEKGAAVARAAVAIQSGIAMAAANPWPVNLAAMASVFAATASIVGNIQAIGMAHDGMDSIPKTGTWLLEKGERVTTAKTSSKLDRVLSEVQSKIGTAQAGRGVVQNFNVTTPSADSFKMSQRQIMQRAKRGLS